MLKRYHIVEGKILPTDAEPAPIWVVVCPDDAEKRLLVDTLKLDEHTLNSALDPDEVSRLEFEPEHLAVIFKRPKSYTAEDNFLFKVLSAGAFLFKDRLVIVLSEDVPLFDGKLFQRTSTVASAMIKLIYRTVYHFIEHLKVINMLSDSLENKISQAMENRYLLSLFTLEKSLVYYLNAINANANVIEKVRAASARLGFTTEDQEALEDLAIENQQCYKQAEIYSNILSSLMDARVSIVNNNISVLMKTLNIITIGIMVPTFVVSAFSMNVQIPFQHHPMAFWIVMGMSFSAMLAFLAWWRLRRW
ncbi:MAG TPA: magnesium transporter CorA family protein [Thermoanaerobaculaceae bacterium]|nr:magnesium transporter CorA family protein [Thermoanaerobaculaceae bacterium]HRS16302.1 magnesium transporter CorA family protein [Thermoanaerobaculaceae bacterium]